MECHECVRSCGPQRGRVLAVTIDLQDRVLLQQTILDLVRQNKALVSKRKSSHPPQPTIYILPQMWIKLSCWSGAHSKNNLTFIYFYVGPYIDFYLSIFIYLLLFVTTVDQLGSTNHCLPRQKDALGKRVFAEKLFTVSFQPAPSFYLSLLHLSIFHSSPSILPLIPPVIPFLSFLYSSSSLPTSLPTLSIVML